MVSEMKAFKDHVIKIRQEISDCGAKAQGRLVDDSHLPICLLARHP
jgi:hypothetical protein